MSSPALIARRLSLLSASATTAVAAPDAACGSARCRCKDCKKTFTPRPNSRAVTPEKEQRILAALSERLSIDAVARMLKVSKNTIYATLKKTHTAD